MTSPTVAASQPEHHQPEHQDPEYHDVHVAGELDLLRRNVALEVAGALRYGLLSFDPTQDITGTQDASNTAYPQIHHPSDVSDRDDYEGERREMFARLGHLGDILILARGAVADLTESELYCMKVLLDDGYRSSLTGLVTTVRLLDGTSN